MVQPYARPFGWFKYASVYWRQDAVQRLTDVLYSHPHDPLSYINQRISQAPLTSFNQRR